MNFRKLFTLFTLFVCLFLFVPVVFAQAPADQPQDQSATPAVNPDQPTTPPAQEQIISYELVKDPNGHWSFQQSSLPANFNLTRENGESMVKSLAATAKIAPLVREVKSMKNENNENSLAGKIKALKAEVGSIQDAKDEHSLAGQIVGLFDVVRGITDKKNPKSMEGRLKGVEGQIADIQQSAYNAKFMALIAITVAAASLVGLVMLILSGGGKKAPKTQESPVPRPTPPSGTTQKPPTPSPTPTSPTPPAPSSTTGTSPAPTGPVRP